MLKKFQLKSTVSQNYHALVFALFVREFSAASVQSFTDAMQPLSTEQIMPNFINGDEGAARDQAADSNWQTMRLLTLKTRFDPSNLLRFARTPSSR